MTTYVINTPRIRDASFKHNEVYIGRPSKWGNPFQIGPHSDRAGVVARYEEWLRTQPELMAALPELKGKILRCWCKPLACHGDVLARLADAT